MEPNEDPVAGAPGADVDVAAVTDGDVAADLARQFEEIEAGRTGTAPPADPNAPPKPAPPASATPEAIQTFIEKNYGGDANAFLHSLYEQRSNGTRQAERIRELEAAVAARNAPPADPEVAFKTARAASDEVASIEGDLKAITDRTKQLSGRQATIMSDMGKKEAERNELNGKLFKAADDEKSDLNLRILSLQSELSTLATEFASNDNAIDINKTNESRLRRELAKAEAQLRDQIDDENAAKARVADTNRRTVFAFNTSFIDQAKEYGVVVTRNADGRIDFSNNAARVLYHSVRTQMIEWLDSQDADAITPTEISNAVRALLTENESAGFIKKKAKAPDPKGRGPGNSPARSAAPALTPPRAPSSADAPVVPPSPGGGPVRDADFYRRRAQFIFTGGQPGPGGLRRRS